MDMSQYLEIFIDETKEHLQGLNQSLLHLEQHPSDTPMVNEIFRVAHTLKGMSATMGFTKMAKLTHDMENVLHLLRNNEVKVTSHVVDLLFQCLDALEHYLDAIMDGGSEGGEGYEDIIKALNLVVQNKSSEVVSVEQPKMMKMPSVKKLVENQAVVIDQFSKNAILKAFQMEMNAFQIRVFLNKGCLLKAARAFIIFQVLEKYSEIIKSEPKVEDIEDEKFDLSFTVICVTKETKELFEKELNSIAEVDKVEMEVIDENYLETFDQKANAQEAETAKTEGVDSSGNRAPNGEKDLPKSKTGKTVRVDIDRLDVLMNLVSELIIIKTRMDGLQGINKTPIYTETVEYLERITTSLHDAVMKVRMVPVETVFNRFPRMIRDIAKDLKKEIALNMSGEETELDRTVIDEIGDPLIHLLRNSADHGLETTDKRKEIGKNPTGQIFLKAYQDGNNVVIEVSDDGQGINLERVKNKAIEKGIVKREETANLTPKDIIAFLFKPSFSTSDQITDLSGRGVGLDVVKTKIEQLGGMVDVETESGQGSKFIIRLPLTLAIIQALLVNIGSEKYAIPLSSTREIIRIPREQIKHIQNQEVILLRNQVVPIVRLDQVLEVQDSKNDTKNITVVVVNKGEKMSGFLVDSLVGQQEIVIKSLGKLLSGIKSIAGATILGDGNVALILDVNSLAI
jgi:two-component system, chemotaxis family, sensor kinase CheA